MTESEAVERIKSGICNEIGTARYCHDNCMHGVEHCAYSMAIQALEEIQSYRAIGTIEEFKALKENDIPIIHGKAELELHDAEIRNKAIDDFMERIMKEQIYGVISVYTVEDIAEQLKGEKQ